MKICTIESLLEMDLATLEAMSNTEIEDYLKDALKVSPPIKAAKVVSDSPTQRSIAVGALKKSLSTSEQLAKMAKEMGMTFVNGKLQE